jgi:hypothetical protein
MKREKLFDAVDLAKNNTANALQLIYNSLNQGQQKR